MIKGKNHQNSPVDGLICVYRPRVTILSPSDSEPLCLSFVVGVIGAICGENNNM